MFQGLERVTLCLASFASLISTLGINKAATYASSQLLEGVETLAIV